MTVDPLEAPCDQYKRIRPLALYEPTCILPADMADSCKWCPSQHFRFLCATCWVHYKQHESNARWAIAKGREIRAQRAADLEICEGILAATEQAEGGVR